MKKIFKSFLFLFILSGCEFRPPSYEFQKHSSQTKCFYPIAEIHKYNSNFSTITECYYTSSQTVKEELIFDANTTEMIGMITYQYKSTYYLKTIFDYINGSLENHYIVATYTIDKNSLKEE